MPPFSQWVLGANVSRGQNRPSRCSRLSLRRVSPRRPSLSGQRWINLLLRDTRTGRSTYGTWFVPSPFSPTPATDESISRRVNCLRRRRKRLTWSLLPICSDLGTELTSFRVPRTRLPRSVPSPVSLDPSLTRYYTLDLVGWTGQDS